MKYFIVLLFLSFSIMSQVIPESSRSKVAIDKYTPLLQTEFTQKGLQLGRPVFIRIFKQEAKLEIWVQNNSRFELFNTYPICTFGFGGLGPKQSEGDGMAPEGFYFVTPQQLNPYSSYHLSFNLGYPNAFDRAYGRTGSALMVHGDCVSIGCYAMTDDKIEEIYTIVHSALNNGQSFFRVHIFPFKMSDENLQKHSNNQWYTFWQNLKQGYDYFEEKRYPPNVTVESKNYIFE